MYDNVRAQYDLVTKKLDVHHLHAVLGWSIGGTQAFQWATQYPDFVDFCIPFCGSARCSVHNQIFLEGVKSALLAGKGESSAGSGEDRVEVEGKENRTWTEKEREVGLKAFGRVYAGWGFSQTFYRQKLYEDGYGCHSLEEFMQKFWYGLSESRPPRTCADTPVKGDLGIEQGSGKFAGHASNLAERRREQAGTVQR